MVARYHARVNGNQLVLRFGHASVGSWIYERKVVGALRVLILQLLCSGNPYANGVPRNYPSPSSASSRSCRAHGKKHFLTRR